MLENRQHLSASPYSGTPISLPNPISFAQFDKGGEGVSYHDTDTVNNGGSTYRSDSPGVDVSNTPGASGGGHTLGYVKAGEWLNYAVNIPTAGAYTLSVNEASPVAGGKYHLEIDGTPNHGNFTTAPITVANTGGWGTYKSIQTFGVQLPAGQHVLRVVFDANTSTGYVANFDSMTLAAPVSADDLVHVDGGTTNGSQAAAIGRGDLGGPSDWQNFEIENVTNAPVTISNVFTPAGFDVDLSINGGRGSGDTSLTIQPNSAVYLFVDAITVSGIAGSRSGTVSFTASGSGKTETGAFKVTANVIGDTPDIPLVSQVGKSTAPTVFKYNLPADDYEDASLTSWKYTDFGTRLYEVHLGAASTVNMQFSATAQYQKNDEADFPSDFTVGVYPDKSNNGKLDGNDLASSVNSLSLRGVIYGTTSSASASAKTLPAGNYFVQVRATNNSDLGSNTYPYTLSFSADPPSPAFNGPPVSLPNTISFSEFDRGGEGVGYHDTDTVNNGGSSYRNDSPGADISNTPGASGNGHTLGYVKAGEWLNYSVDVPATGAYTLSVKEASPVAGGKFHLEIDGTPNHGSNTTAPITVANTGGWGTYQTIQTFGVQLPIGKHVLRVVFDANNSTGYVGNFDSLALT